MLSTTKGQLYIVELDNPNEKLEIQFMPQELPISRRADLSPVKIVGRNNPKNHFTGGEESLKLNLDFYADDENKETVLNKVNWLLGLTYDDASRVKLVWGRMFKKHVFRVSQVNPTYSYFWPNNGMLPGQAKVDITLVVDTITDLRRADIRRT